MPNVSRRQLAVLRLLHGGAALRDDGNDRGFLTIAHPVVPAPDLQRLERAGWIERRKFGQFAITEKGRDEVRVHDDIDLFTESQ